MERSYVETSLGNISMLTRPGNNAIIFLHGLGSNGNTWLKVAPLLDRKYGIYMLDLLGHGRSAKPPDRFTIADQCIILSEVISKLHITRFTLIGHSYGGWVSMRYFLSATAKPEKLVLIDSAGTNPTVGEAGEESISSFVDKIMQLNSPNERDLMLKFVTNNTRPEEKISYDAISGIDIPVMIIWGEKDRIIPVQYAIRLQEKLPNSILKIIPGASHTPQTLYFREIADYINSFLSK